jgi:hypothetical protein
MESPGQELEQGTVNIIKKLMLKGKSPEDITEATDVPLGKLKEIMVQTMNDPEMSRGMLDIIRTKADELRCPLTKQLMLNPVMTGDNRSYEQSAIEARISEGNLTEEEQRQVSTRLPNQDLKKKVRVFCLNTIDTLEIILRVQYESDTANQLATECLTILDPDSDFEYYRKVIAAAGSQQFTSLLERLQKQCTREVMRTVHSRLLAIPDFQMQAKVMTLQYLAEPQEFAYFEHDLRALIVLVRATGLGAEHVDQLLQIARRCNPQQLNALRAELISKEMVDRFGVKIHEFSFIEAESCIADNDVGTAQRLIRELWHVPQLEERLNSFYDKHNWRREKQDLMARAFSNRLETIKQEGVNPALIEILRQLYMMNQTGATIDELKQELRRDADKMLHDVRRFETKLNKLDAIITGWIDQKAVQEERVKMKAVDRNIHIFENAETVYSYKQATEEFYWTSLETGLSYTHSISRQFNFNCSWCELPNKEVFFIGGGPSNEVFSVNADTRAVTVRPTLITPRYGHGSVYNQGHIYVIGGFNTAGLKECERFLIEQNRWEALAPLPEICFNSSIITLEGTNSLYALGGSNGTRYTEDIYELSFERLAWRKLEVKLPNAVSDRIASFRLPGRPSYIYFVQGRTLCVLSLAHNAIRELKAIPYAPQNCFGACVYSGDFLVCSNLSGQSKKYAIGSIN